MIITDLKTEFYNKLIGKRVLILVHYDIDAICASKIIQHLFSTDHVLYTLVPVKTRNELVEAYYKHTEQIQDILLVNCGGCIDVVDLLQPKENVRLYIADNHRPLDVCNIYNDGQVFVISKLDNESEVPAFEDVFQEDESEDEMESDGEGGKRQRFDEEFLEKQRQKRMWEQRRNKLLFDYTQFSSYSSSTSMLFYDLSWKLSKDSNELLWWSVVGVTEMFLCNKIEPDKYLLATASLQNHVSRLNHQSQDEKPLDSLKIMFDKEVHLSLYRHWNLIESMKNSTYVCTTLKLWTLKGEKRMHELLADMGLPLMQCRQLYSSMDMPLKQELLSLLEAKTEKYGLDNLVYASFTLCHGFKRKFNSADYVHALSALMESPDAEKSSAYAFLDAGDSLNINDMSLIESGISGSKQQLNAIYRQVTIFLNMNQVICAGPLLYTTVLPGSPDAIFFSSPHSLYALAQFTLQAFVATSRNKKSRSLPLVIAAPDTKGEHALVDSLRRDTGDTCLVCGIPPVSEHSARNFFGKAFEQAVEKTASSAEMDFFDTHIIRLNSCDRSKFFDALLSMLC